MNTPDLETKRLILRKFTEEDIPALYQIYRDTHVNTYLPWFPITSIQEAQELYYKKYAEMDEKPSRYQYAICLKENNIPIGYVHVSMEEHHDIGYAVRKEYWHQGIVKEACLEVVKQIKKDGLPYITATHDIHNPRSGHVMQAIGMKYQYTYEELWQPKNFLVTFRMYQLNFNEADNFVYLNYWNRHKHHFIEEHLYKERPSWIDISKSKNNSL